MKKKRKFAVRVIAIILAVMMLLGMVISALVVFSENLHHDAYTLDIFYDEVQEIAYVSQNTHYVNQTGVPLDYVSFSLYANAYRRQPTTPFDDMVFDDAYPGGFEPGGVDFISVAVDGEAANWGVAGDREQVMRVEVSLAPGQSAAFDFVYAVLLPPAHGLLGTGELSVRLCDFYPIAAVYNRPAGDYVSNPYVGITQVAVSGTADYHVRVNAPEGYRVISGGERESEVSADGRVIWSFETASARSVGVVLGNRYAAAERKTQSGIPVRAFTSRTAHSERALETAVRAVELYSEWFGPYPYASLDIVQAEYVYGAASYTGLIIIDDDLLREGGSALTRAIAEQVSAQWLTCAVGVDRGENPWLGDALTAYMALLFVESNFGADEYRKQIVDQAGDALNITIPGGLTTDSPISRFQTAYEYDIVVRDRGIAVLHLLRDVMGDEAFKRAAARYIQSQWMAFANTDDFIRALDEASGGSWRQYVTMQLRDINEYVGSGAGLFD